MEENVTEIMRIVMFVEHKIVQVCMKKKFPLSFEYTYMYTRSGDDGGSPVIVYLDSKGGKPNILC